MSTHYFDCCGPYDLSRVGPKERWDEKFPAWRREFRQRLEADKVWEGLPDALGCYAFCIRHGTSYTAWYIGKTVKRGFGEEVFSKGNEVHYGNILAPAKTLNKRGQPCVLLFPRVRESGHLTYHRGERAKNAISQLEDQLIHMAWIQNPDLNNVSGKRRREKFSVFGVIGPQTEWPRVNKSARAARLALGTAIPGK